MPLISIADDFGDIVHGLFLDPEQNNGKVVQAFSDMVKFDDIVKQFSEGTFLPFLVTICSFNGLRY